MGEPKHKTVSSESADTPQSIGQFFPFKHSLDVGNSGILVAWAQAKLAEHGVYTGPIDGRYDREVVLAVRKYQDSQGLKITGIIDRKTWERL